MKYTETPPTHQGFYWWKQNKTSSPRVKHVAVSGLNGVLTVNCAGIWRQLRYLGGLWWPEPIVEPKEE